MDTIFLERMKMLLQDEYDDFIASFSHDEVKGFYLNPIKKDVMKHLDEKLISKHPYIKDGYYFDKDYRLGKHPYFHCGLYYIQEPSAMCVEHILPIEENDYVLDMCAAPGGKTCYVASQLSNQGLMIANDINRLRATILSHNVERFGLENTIVTNSDPSQLKETFRGFFDKIILDAPCSGEGMFRKLDQAISTWSIDKVNECAYLQRKLINDAYSMLKQDGILLYSTCTYSLEENEQQVDYMVNTLNMELLEIKKEAGMSSGYQNDKVVRMYPHINHGEGQFIALLKKKEDTKTCKVSMLKANLSKQQLDLVKQFYQENLTIKLPKYLYQSNNHVYAILPHFPEIKKTKILRNGLYLGECKKNRFVPSLSLALTLEKKDVKRYVSFSSDAKEVEQYLRGETLIGTGKKGYGVIFVDDYPLSFYKESNMQIKNLYPKGLRI